MKLKKVSDYVLNMEAGIIADVEKWTIIPTFVINYAYKYLNITFSFLFIDIYACFTIKNYMMY